MVKKIISYLILIIIFIFTTYYLIKYIKTPKKIERLSSLAIKSYLYKEIDPERYKNTDILLIKEDYYIKFDDDGTSKSNHYLVIKPLTQKGIEKYKYIYNYINSEYDTSFILYATVYKKNGEIINIDPKKKFKIEEYSNNNDIYYENTYMYATQIPQLEVGDILEFEEKKIVRKPNIENEFDFRFFWGGDYYTNESRLFLDIPKKKQHKIKIINDFDKNVKLTKKKFQNRLFYEAKVFNLPANIINIDEGLTNNDRITLLVSTFTWEKLSKYNYQISEKSLKINDKIKEFVNNMRKKYTDKNDLLKAIYYYTAQEIRYLGLGSNTKIPNPVTDTFEMKAGVCKDKAALLTAMLREAGFEAYLALTSYSEKIYPDIPMDLFDHEIVAVYFNNNLQYFDNTDYLSKKFLPTYAGNKPVLILKPEGDSLRTIPESKSYENSIFIKAINRINNEKNLTSELDITLNGYYDEITRKMFLYTTFEDQKTILNEYFKALGENIKFEKITFYPEDLSDLWENINIKIKLNIENFGTSASNYYIIPSFALNNIANIILDFYFQKFNVKNKEYTINTEAAITMVYNETIIYPNNFILIALPENKKINNDDFIYDLDSNNIKNTIIINKFLAIKKSSFALNSLNNIRLLRKNLEQDQKRRIIFREKR